MYGGSQRYSYPCRNGPECHYLEQGRCFFYHPESHKRQYNRGSNIFRSNSSQISRTSLNLTQLYNILMGRTQLQRREERKREAERKAEEQRQEATRRAEQLRRQRELLQQQRIQQAERRELIRRSYMRQIEEQQILRNQGLLKNRLTKQNENFVWFFGKNKSFPADKLTETQLESCDQCPICYEQFIEGQHQECEVKPEKKPQETSQEKPMKKLEQDSDQQDLSKILETMLNLEQNNGQSKNTSENSSMLTQLFCKHIFHTGCIKQWLQKTPQCAICRKDFRDHEAYAQHDKSYKSRFQAIKTTAATTSLMRNLFTTSVQRTQLPMMQTFLNNNSFESEDIFDVEDDQYDDRDYLNEYGFDSDGYGF